MFDKVLTAPDGTQVMFTSPEKPEYEVITVDEVGRRLAQLDPRLGADICDLLADAVVVWAPLPTEFGRTVGQAISLLQEVCALFERSVPNNESVVLWSEEKRELQETADSLRHLRDRLYRTCSHTRLEPAPEGDVFVKSVLSAYEKAGMKLERLPTEAGARRCCDCGAIFGGGGQRPGRTFVPCSASGDLSGERLPGRAAFLYFATNLIRKGGHKKMDAMKLAARIIEAFWDNDSRPYEDHQLEGAYAQGRTSCRRNNIVSVDQFVSQPGLRNSDNHLVWVPIRRYPKTTSSGVPSPDGPTPPDEG